MTAPPPRRAATLDLGLVRGLADSFPNSPWQTTSTRVFIVERNGGVSLSWRSAKHLKSAGGVYAVLLPTAWFSTPRVLGLHPPNGHHGVAPIQFEFTVPDHTGDGYGVVYIGRATKFCQRWGGHLTTGARKRGGQVKYGLMDCGLYRDEATALRALREHARIIYTALPGPGQCANRDILEMSLCARFGPAFNIKSER